MSTWNQPLCRTCLVAFRLGMGSDPHIQPTRMIDVSEPCLVCGEPNEGIYVRIDPRLTRGFANVRVTE